MKIPHENLLLVPWPGSAWLRRMANDPANSFSFQGRTYHSAYEAVLNGDPASNPVKNFNAFINSFVVPHNISIFMVKIFGTFWGHHVISYIRNFLAGCIVYYGTGAVFHYHCYVHPRSKDIFKDRKMPSNEIILDQIKLAQASLFIYVLLPVISEYVIEEGYTKCYYTMEEIGGFLPYLVCTLVYFVLVEIGIYWVCSNTKMFISYPIIGCLCVLGKNNTQFNSTQRNSHGLS